MKLNSAAAPLRSGSGRAVEFGQTALTRCLSWRHCQLGDRRLPEMYDIRGICPPPEHLPSRANIRPRKPIPYRLVPGWVTVFEQVYHLDM